MSRLRLDRGIGALPPAPPLAPADAESPRPCEIVAFVMALYTWWSSQDVVLLALLIVTFWLAQKNEARIRRAVAHVKRLSARVWVFLGPVPARIFVTSFVATLSFGVLVANDQVAEVHFKDVTDPGAPPRRTALTDVEVDVDAGRRFVEVDGVVETGNPKCRNRRTILVLGGRGGKVGTVPTLPDGSFSFAWTGPRLELVFRALKSEVIRGTRIITCTEDSVVVRKSDLGRFRRGEVPVPNVVPRLPDSGTTPPYADPPVPEAVPDPVRPDPGATQRPPEPARPDPETPRPEESPGDTGAP